MTDFEIAVIVKNMAREMVKRATVKNADKELEMLNRINALYDKRNAILAKEINSKLNDDEYRREFKRRSDEAKRVDKEIEREKQNYQKFQDEQKYKSFMRTGSAPD